MLDESPLQKAGLKRRPPPLVLEDAKEAAVPPPQRARVEVFSENFVLLVQQVEVGGEGTRLKCRSFEDEHEEFGVRLRDLWANTRVRAGHTIRLLEAVRLGPHEFEVTNARGRLIVEPFNLLTATSIASSLYCKRKAVLQNRFRSGGTSRVMLIGCIVHEVFQTAITRTEAPTPDGLLEFCRAIAFRKYGVELLLNDVDLPLLECDLRPYLRNIAAWLRKHAAAPVGAGEPLGLGGGEERRVRAVESVEHEFRSAMYGVKGKIDVALNLEDSPDLFPLELKSGKSAGSVEHRAQVVAYSLMLTEERNADIVPGLLLYLKDNTTRAIRSSPVDVAGFLGLRNEMAAHFSAFEIEELPAIEKPARLCEVCEQLDTCALLRRLSVRPAIPEGEEEAWAELRRLMDGRAAHLTAGELEYAGRWIRWILAEWEHQFAQQTTAARLSDSHQSESFYSHGLMLQNVSRLMADTDESRRLRSLLIEKRPPEFAEPTELPPEVAACLEGLDEPQQAAVRHCLSAADFAVVQGLPGAGKTTMIAALVQALVASGKSVLLTSHTHSAVDNMLMKLKGKIPAFRLLRVGAEKSLHADVLELGLEARLEKFAAMGRLTNAQRMAHLKRALFQSAVVGATALSAASHALFARRRFDVCVVDEASLALECVALGPLFAADRFVLVGDTRQLSPLVINAEIAQQGMAVSLMERLLRAAGGEQAVSLTWQYRMNREICALASGLFYDSRLVCANKEVSEATLKCDQTFDENLPIEVSAALLSGRSEDAVVFVDVATETAAFESHVDRRLQSRFNEGEAALVARLVDSLVQNGVPPADVGVITPYRAQVECLQRALQAAGGEQPEVSTIDRFQGRDKAVVLLSLVYGHNELLSNDPAAHLADQRRLNVAFTRAKRKLVLVGRRAALSPNDFFARILARIPTHVTFR